jgi:hypothetical protein
MLIVELLVNENLIKAETALSGADGGNIVELCRKYISLLTKYREELSKLRGIPEINFQQSSSLARELTEQVRKAIRSTIEITTRERNHTESLLESFTAISGYEAAETFNRLKYKGFENWELRAGGVRPKDAAEDNLITMQEAVEQAGLLRREAYVSEKLTFFK